MPVVVLFSGKTIFCDDLVYEFDLSERPAAATLTVDVDPQMPAWPFYYGGLVSVSVNGNVAKSYDPPLLDRDVIDIANHLRVGRNKITFSFKVGFLLCHLGSGVFNAVMVVDRGNVIPSPVDGGVGGINMTVILLVVLLFLFLLVIRRW